MERGRVGKKERKVNIYYLAMFNGRVNGLTVLKNENWMCGVMLGIVWSQIVWRMLCAK